MLRGVADYLVKQGTIGELSHATKVPKLFIMPAGTRAPNPGELLAQNRVGELIQEALRVLRQRGVRRALVTGGGDMAAGDPPPGKNGWRIEVAPLDVTNAPPARFVLLARCGLATSGDLFQRLEIDDRRYSHVVDPRTGLGLTDHSLVTVMAQDAMTADGLSKVVSVLGPEKGFTRVEETPRAAAYVVRVPETTIQTKETRHFRNYLEVTQPQAALGDLP